MNYYKERLGVQQLSSYNIKKEERISQFQKLQNKEFEFD
jgi:hypothetical protein